MTTVTTVGHGDLYPVTAAGRVVAAALMVVGISVLGIVTAGVGRLHRAGVLTADEVATTRSRIDAQDAST